MDIQTLLLFLLALSAAAVVLLIVLLLRRPEARLEQALREEQRSGRGELREQLDSLSKQQETRIEGFGRNLADLSIRTDQRLDVLRDSLAEDARKGRLEAAESQQRFADVLSQRLNELTQRNELRIAEMRATLEDRLTSLQADNTAKLEQMRQTVDEKLHATLETRLTESFGNVTAMLAQVHQGLGDMNKLAADVGGLQRVLSNVKSRGVFGEVQLGNLLEQVFTPDQYAANVVTVPGSNERVEYAVRFPGSSTDSAVWLPIDAKFPREDYERLLDAQERADVEGVRVAGDALERAIKKQAQEIRKYVAAPHTTEFAIMFLPTEGLYAEVLRRPGLFEAMQRDHRITLAGPTTLLALLTSLQVGFRTVAIEKRSAEVWRILGAAKSEFGKFGDVLDSVKNKLEQASKQIDNTGVRTRAIARTLREVETLPGEETQKLLDTAADNDEAE
ncbi:MULTISPECIES: DNA recombination protein RmuC [unclassified Pseudoxanthomonas]|jgi:DNA recombination protein RmuC|uniref:DNA recombination protein RmuC n=1 Tax=unclassified Pseudoxanthomonas TaxID=2645906 RepID=UPI003077E755